MSWTDLEPIVKTVPRVQSWMKVLKDGNPRLYLFLSETFLKETGNPKAVNIQAGEFDGVCKLRLAFGSAGKFKINDMKHGGSRITNIPSTSAMPDGARETEPCEVESSSKTEAIIILPLTAWKKQVQPSPPAPQRQAAVVETPAVPTRAAAPGRVETRESPDLPLRNGRIDAVEYLTKKGVKISRKGNGYLIEGELHSKSSTLVTVNRYRRAASLPDLKLTDID